MSRRVQRAVALACFLALCFASSDARAAYEREYLGVNVQAMVKRFPPEAWPGFLATAREGGFTGARYDAGWGDVEPTAPQGARRYRWDKLDRFVTMTSSAGIRWAPVLSVVPRWARDPDGRFTANHYGDFVAFSAALAGRYGPGGDFWRAHPELPPLPPTLYEVWNEPNSANAWNRVPEPAEYTALFTRVRSAIKGVDPAAAVAVSLAWENPEEFIAGMARTGDPAWAGDGFAFHPYAPTAVGVVALMRKLAGALAAHGRPGAPLYINEIGWPRAFGAPAAHAWSGKIADETRGASLSIVGDALQRSDCGVRLYAPYSLVEPEQDRGNVEDWMGILHRDGTATAAFTSLRAAARRELPAAKGTLALCGKAGTSDPEALLPFAMQASRTTAGCFAATVSYFGNPLEQSTVTAYRGTGRASAETDAFGSAALCAPAGSEPIMLRAAIPDVGVSAVLRCPSDRSSCSRVADGDAAGNVAGDGNVRVINGAARRCGVQLVGSADVRVRRGKVRMRVAARDACAPLRPRGKIRVRVYVARSTGRPRFVRTTTVARRARTVSLPVRTRDRRVLLVGRVGGPKGPKITRRVTLRRSSR